MHENKGSDIGGAARNQDAAERSVARLEVIQEGMTECIKAQVSLNDRLMGLANGLCGGPPKSPDPEKQPPSSIPSGLAEEMEEVLRNIIVQQTLTGALINRLSAAIPDRR